MTDREKCAQEREKNKKDIEKHGRQRLLCVNTTCHVQKSNPGVCQTEHTTSRTLNPPPGAPTRDMQMFPSAVCQLVR